jgi:Mbeg1-like
MFVGAVSSTRFDSLSALPPEPEHSPVPSVSFADQVRGTGSKAIDLDMALISQDVYKADSAGRIGADGWSRVSDQDLLAHGIDPENLHSDATGFQAGIYSDGRGNYVLAFAGTDFKSIADWRANLGQGLGFNTAQYNQAVALAQDARDAFGANLAITGHSLGGGLASAAALATGSPAVTFNAAGLSDQTLRDLGFSPNQEREIASDGLVRRYDTQHDILTNLQQNVLPFLPRAVGSELRISDSTLNPINAHSMSTVIQGMEAGKVTPVKPAVNPAARVDEATFDVATGVVRQGSGLVRDTVGVGKEMVQNVGRDLAHGRPIAAVGDVAKASLQTTGNIANRGFNVAGNVVQAGGNLFGGLIRDAGSLVGRPGAGNTAGGWVEQQTQRAGNVLDTVGGKLKSGLDAAANLVKSWF